MGRTHLRQIDLEDALGSSDHGVSCGPSAIMRRVTGHALKPVWMALGATLVLSQARSTLR